MTKKQKDASDKISALALEFSKNKETQAASTVLYTLCGAMYAEHQDELALYVAEIAKEIHADIIRMQESRLNHN